MTRDDIGDLLVGVSDDVNSCSDSVSLASSKKDKSGNSVIIEDNDEYNGTDSKYSSSVNNGENSKPVNFLGKNSMRIESGNYEVVENTGLATPRG